MSGPSHATRSRRYALRLVSSTVTVALAGCLDRGGVSERNARSDRGGASPGATPGDTTPNAQFQYNARHTGVSGTDAPERIERRWRSRVSPIEGGLAVSDGRALVTTGGSLVALSTDDGRELWTADVGHDSDAAPVLSDDTAYVTTWNGGANVDRGVAAIDLADGRERWRAVPDVDVSSAATLSNDTLYVGGSINSRHVIALDARDGTQRWRFQAGQHAPTPAVSRDVVYVGGGSEPVAYALDAADGGERWRVDVDDRVWGAPTISDGTVYVGTRSGTVYALDAADGEEVWHGEIGGDVRGSLAVTGDTVYVPDRGSIHALSTDGEELWSVSASGYVFAPTVAADSVVVTDRSEAVGLDATTGAERWRHEVRERTISDMVFTGITCEPVVHDRVVYVASHGGDVYALQRPG